MIVAVLPEAQNRMCQVRFQEEEEEEEELQTDYKSITEVSHVTGTMLIWDVKLYPIS